ncbi:MAG: ABC transporter permease [Thermoflexales bacterium]|nr:ABC transporter permease [Thermoflexales bacterium]
MDTRWHKVLADLWADPLRSILMIITIAVGLFSVGFNVTIGDIAMHDMDADYAGANGHAAILYCDPFPKELLSSLRRVPGVEWAEGRSSVTAQVSTAKGKLRIQLMAIPIPDEMRIDRLRLVSAGEYAADGFPPLREREVYLDRSALTSLPVEPGGAITVELADGKKRSLKVAAIVHDVNAIPADFGMPLSAYVNSATIEWLGGTPDANIVYLTVKEKRTDTVHVTAVAQAVSDKLEASRQKVYRALVYHPGRHYVKDMFQAIVAILSVLGVMAVLLSTFLVVNIINALLSQHIRAIGIMKAIGGCQHQLMGMYLVLVLVLGGLAFLVAVGPAALAGYGVAKGLGTWLNFDVAAFRFSTPAVVLQAAIALIVPSAAALVPVWNGTRTSVREAISNYGLGKGLFGASWVDRLVERLRFLSRPLLISLRNTFRRKTRLALTLFTLTLGGAVFIGVFNLWAAINGALAELRGYYLADVNVTFNQPYRLDRVQALVEDVDGVTAIEGWGYQAGQLLAPDRQSAEEIIFIAPPSGSSLVKPIVLAGRWLAAGDENAIVIDTRLLKARPDLRLGDTIVTKIRDREYPWRIVGIYKLGMTINQTWVYVNNDYLSRLLNESGRVSNVRVIASSHDPQAQARLAKGLEVLFQENGLQLAEIIGGADWLRRLGMSYDVLVYFLLVMAVLVAIVGGMGLTGAMSMNVMERRREIGVMRATGARDGAILRLVMVEGMFVSLLSWGLAVPLSIPLTLALNSGVGSAMVGLPLDFTFGLRGVWTWLLLALAIAALASGLPAWNATRLTVREALSYE